MLVSVITPTRDRATTYLPETIESVACQELPAGWTLEHIVCDDASSASQQQRLRELASVHPHVRVVVRSESGGVSAARNDAFRASSGAVVIDLDDDDMLPSTSVRDRVTHLLASGANWSCGDMLKVTENGVYRIGRDLARRDGIPKTGQQALEMFARGTLHAWAGTRTYRREAIVDAGPWDPTYPVAEDLEHWMRLSAVAGPPAWCAQWLVLHREKDQSLGIDAVRSGLMTQMVARACTRWDGHRIGDPLPSDVPTW